MNAAARGAIAGVAGGLVFGVSMAVYGMLPTVASIVRTDSAVVGFAVHMVFAVIIGAGFGLIVSRQRELVLWGLLYGAFWWFLGPLTLLPLFRGEPVSWDLSSARALLPSLIGHLCYGMAVALVYMVLRGDQPSTRPPATALVRGGLAGVIAGMLSHLGWGWLIGLAAGLLYPYLFRDRENTGPALVRGAVYGFLWWVLFGLTAEPLLLNVKLDWARPPVDQLPGYLLLGGLTAVLYTWLGSVARGLFVDDVRMFPVESPGARGFRAVGYGAVAGLVGGALFTVVMVVVGVLPLVASMVGSSEPVVGLIVHLVISQIIGASYAVLFRRQSFDAVSGIGWGLCYGFFWWILGNLTLLPVFTGSPVRWDPAALAAGFPSLAGHLAYGAALGAVYYWLESRTNPWWMTRNAAEQARVQGRRQQSLGSAPALWTLTVFIALTVPVLIP
ncbi:hypothetical protein [Kibdelosporangium aridum]|uniref:DUF1440 domain-containing protein n=1 Tax=Kibdelosporangium aridum TaxID=2030 RepID=A0A1W2FLJ1_KIBAR|nr:hypothetical protein [Kibdelosporangium aridum]SMD22815.1 hypothetical protein SAMN05661093_07617 [Kibdelosporangium aridum]